MLLLQNLILFRPKTKKDTFCIQNLHWIDLSDMWWYFNDFFFFCFFNWPFNRILPLMTYCSENSWKFIIWHILQNLSKKCTLEMWLQGLKCFIPDKMQFWKYMNIVTIATATILSLSVTVDKNRCDGYVSNLEIDFLQITWI